MDGLGNFQFILVQQAFVAQNPNIHHEIDDECEPADSSTHVAHLLVELRRDSGELKDFVKLKPTQKLVFPEEHNQIEHGHIIDGGHEWAESQTHEDNIQHFGVVEVQIVVWFHVQILQVVVSLLSCAVKARTLELSVVESL